MSSTPFGDHLRRERELRGVSLQEISAATRISTRYLEAIEKEQWQELPGGAFNRGFIRSIARFLGLDEDGLVAEYSLGLQAPAKPTVGRRKPAEMPSVWQRAGKGLVAIAVVILLLLAGVLVYRRYGARIAARLHRQASTVFTPGRMGSFATSLEAAARMVSATGNRRPVRGGLYQR